MFGTIIITFVITALAMACLFMVDKNQQKDKESQRLCRENDSLRKQVNNYCIREHETRVNNAYSKGLYDGRKTDALYRQTLSKFHRSEQTDVMMYGENYQEENQ